MHTAATLIVSVALLLQSAPPQIQLVVVGEISKVEKLKRSFQVRTKENPKEVEPVGDIRIGTRIGKTDPALAPFPGSPRRPSEPFPDRDDPFESGADPRRLPNYTITNVFITDATSCKDNDRVVLCDDLKLKDHVRISGHERREARGKGLYATEIVRTH